MFTNLIHKSQAPLGYAAFYATSLKLQMDRKSMIYTCNIQGRILPYGVVAPRSTPWRTDL